MHIHIHLHLHLHIHIHIHIHIYIYCNAYLEEAFPETSAAVESSARIRSGEQRSPRSTATCPLIPLKRIPFKGVYKGSEYRHLSIDYAILGFRGFRGLRFRGLEVWGFWGFRFCRVYSFGFVTLGFWGLGFAGLEFSGVILGLWGLGFWGV